MLFQISLSFEKSPIEKYQWIYRNTCWFNVTVLSRTIIENTGVTFIGIETIQKDIHFLDYKTYICVEQASK